MNDVIAGVRSRKRVSSPWDSIATHGQNVSSKMKKTFRRAMMRSRCAKAQVRAHSPRSASACELNEDLLQLGLLHLTVTHEHGPLMQPTQDLGQALLGCVRRALDALPPHVELQDARQLAETLRDGRV